MVKRNNKEGTLEENITENVVKDIYCQIPFDLVVRLPC